MQSYDSSDRQSIRRSQSCQLALVPPTIVAVWFWDQRSGEHRRQNLGALDQEKQVSLAKRYNGFESSAKNPMVQTPLKKQQNSPDRRIIHSGLTWEQFELIQQGFAESPGIRLSYYEGTIEIYMLGQDHELFSCMIAALLNLFLAGQGILFFPVGSADQVKKGIAFTQPDQSYCIGSRKSIPDLSIEVIFTSGSIAKLELYQALGVTEVWFWEDGTLNLYHLTSGEYVQIDHSQLEGLQDLDIDLLKRCILLAETDPGNAMRTFQQAI
jgi:Uma2 family endonuclease